MTIWVCGRTFPDVVDAEGFCMWELLGLYSTEEAAVARCRSVNDFVSPIPLDVDMPEERVLFPGAYNPLYVPEAGH